MFIEVGCESCNYSFDLIFGYCGKSTFRPYRCNDCKRYFIAKIPPQFHGTKRMSLYKDIKAVAVLDEEKMRHTHILLIRFSAKNVVDKILIC